MSKFYEFFSAINTFFSWQHGVEICKWAAVKDYCRQFPNSILNCWRPWLLYLRFVTPFFFGKVCNLISLTCTWIELWCATSIHQVLLWYAGVLWTLVCNSYSPGFALLITFLTLHKLLTSSLHDSHNPPMMQINYQRTNYWCKIFKLWR